MKIAFSPTSCDVAPVFILLYLPQAGKPIKNPTFKCFWIEKEGTPYKWITYIVYVEMQQICQITIVEV